MHDGDKVQYTALDFIQDLLTKSKTEARAYLDFQLKNNALGKWNEAKGRYDEFTGNILVDGNIVSLSGNRAEALDKIYDIFGMNEEELNMHTKMFNVYMHAVYERAKKEFNKHYNSIYEIISTINSTAVEGFKLSQQDINKLEGVIKLERSGVHSHISRQKISMSESVVNMLKHGNKDVSQYVNDMDLVGQTAIYLLNKNKDIGTSQELYDKTLKEIDKFISRGDFDRFYEESSAKAVFDELSGIRNTGLTHGYATKLRMASVELSKIDPTDFMAQLAEFNSSKLDINILSDMKRKQKYYSKSIDLFVDNMIESAISAKHGLTLGGLEGSKIFINELLDYSADSLNTRVINMFDDTFINNKERKMINLFENVSSYKKLFDERSEVLETIIDELKSEKLNDQYLYKYLDLGEAEFNSVFKEILNKKDIEKYSEFAKRYQKEVSNIEVSMFKNLMKDKYVDQEEFRIFQGLNLFGELLIQNDPGLEYDVDEVTKALQQYNDNIISYEELLKNKDIINLKSQVQISLGSAASISNIGKLREYLSAFVANKGYERLKDDFETFVKQNNESNEILKKHNLNDVFNDNFSIKDKFSKEFSDEFKKELDSKFVSLYNGLIYRFNSNVSSNVSDPMKVFLEELNKNYTLFSSSGLEANASLSLLDEFKNNGLGSVNKSSLSNSLERVNDKYVDFLNKLAKRYSDYDSDFSNFTTDNLISGLNNNPDDIELQSGIINELNNAIDNALFNKYKKDIPQLKIGNSSMIKFRFANKLTKDEIKLKEWGKLYQIFTEKMYNNTPINYMFQTVESDGRKFLLDDMSIFYDKEGKFDTSTFNKVVKFAENKNLYFSERIAKMIFNSGDFKNSFLSEDDRYRLGQDLLNARKYLGEDFTEENVLKRMTFKFDSELATKTALSRYMHVNNIERNYKFEEKMSNTLKSILEDFKTVDGSISNDYVNPNYVKMAKTYIDADKNYKSTRDLTDATMRFARTQRSLNRIISSQRKWFEENEVDIDLFSKLATVEMINQEKATSENIRKALLNVARAMTGGNVSDLNINYNKYVDNTVDMISQNRKAVGIAGMLASGALVAGSIIKPFFTKENGTYTLSKTGQKLTEKEILSKLNFGNGMKTNMLNEELKDLSLNAYVDVNKKKYF